MNSKDIKEFYDKFLESKMLQYRINGNRRITKATKRVIEYIREDSFVLEIGCGIGIITEEISKINRDGHTWAIDISTQNIWYSKQTVGTSNITFMVLDIVDEFEKLKKKITKPIDVVVLVDVIEHIPKDEHEKLFKNIEEIASSDSIIILTYPSPQLQTYLKENKCQELQIIDETIKLYEIIEPAQSAGFNLRHYSLEYVWSNNEYIHCILQNNNSLESKAKPKRKPFRELVLTLKFYLDRLFLNSFNRWRYVDKVFD